MNPTDLGKILVAANLVDPRIEVTEATVMTWHTLIGHLPSADVAAAIEAHLQHTRDRVMPSDVLERVRAVRSQRLKDVTDADLTADIDPSAPGEAYVNILRARKRLVADGLPLHQAIASVAVPKEIEARRG